MSGYLLKKFLGLTPTLIGIVTLVFFMVRLIPGDPAAAVAGEQASAERLAAVRERMGLNQPLSAQYVQYWKHLFQLDLGRSVHTGLPVMETIESSLPVTAALAVASVLVGSLIGIPIGTLAAYARSRGRAVGDHALTGAAMAVDTMPVFWLALVFILVFSLQLHILPVSGKVQWSHLDLVVKRLAMPAIILGLAQLASVVRVTRTAVLESLSEDYVRTARALGTPESTILFRHALRSSLLPIVTLTGLSLGRLLGGTVVMESIFSLPGLGTQLLGAINGRDYTLIQGIILVFALTFILVNLATDLVYTRIDPRVRLH